MALKQRARRAEDKQARRDAILNVAASLLSSQDFSDITMANVARASGLAKGTLYLYFNSKEALFLGTVERELSAWFDELALLLLSGKKLGPDGFGDVVATSLAQRPTLTHLMTILHTVLERNIDAETARSFKRFLAEKLADGGQVLEGVLTGLPHGAGASLMLRIHALVVGFRQMSETSPTVSSILEGDEFAALRVDFRDDLSRTVAALVRGMQRVVIQPDARAQT